MNLRDFLDERESELLAEITRLRAQLVPLESELSLVRRAKVAVGPRPHPDQRKQLEEELASIERAFQKSASLMPPISKETEDFLADAGEATGANDRGAEVVAALDEMKTTIAEVQSAMADSFAQLRNPHANLTMKQLAVKALEEQFPHGATTRQLIDFFRDAWGREIERTNLSPQLSRLYQEGKIGRIQGLKEWYLVPLERQGRRPYRVLAPVINLNEAGDLQSVTHRPGDIVWLLPNEVAGDHFEPLNVRPIPDPDPDED